MYLIFNFIIALLFIETDIYIYISMDWFKGNFEQESPIIHGKIYGFRFRFSLKPIHGPPLLAPQLPHLPPLPSEERRYEEARRGCSAKGQPWDPEKYMAYMGSMGFNSDL